MIRVKTLERGRGNVMTVVWRLLPKDGPVTGPLQGVR